MPVQSPNRKTLLKLFLTLALTAFLVTRIDLSSLASVIGSARLAILVPGVLVHALLMLIAVARWRAVLKDFRITIEYLPLAQITWIGNFFSLFLPSSIGGDLFRAYYLAKKKEKGIATTLTTTVLERSAGLGALLLIGLASVLTERIEVQGVQLVHVFLVLIAGYLLVNLALFNSKLHDLISRILQKWNKQSIDAKLEWVYRGLQTLSRNRRTILEILLYSLVIQFLSVLIVWITAQSLSIDASFRVFLIFVPLINLSIMVPLTINGFGLRESLYLLLFAQIGLQEEKAVALSLLNTVVIMVAVLPGGLMYSFYKNKEDLNQVREEAEAYEELPIARDSSRRNSEPK
jgi:uncharacterized protein (TIRG00374 family)